MKKLITLFCTLFCLFMFPHTLFSMGAVVENPHVFVDVLYANVQIEEFIFSSVNPNLVFARLTDSSIWKINPQDLKEIHDNEYSMTFMPVTIMADVGGADYPVLFLVHRRNKTYYLTATLESPPTDPSKPISIKQIDSLSNQLMLESNPDQSESPVHIKIDSSDTSIFKHWKEGEKVVIGGVWFGEFDPQKRPHDIFSLYNYDTNEMIFFDLAR